MSRTRYGFLVLLLVLGATACGPREGNAPSYDPAPPPRFIGRQTCEGCHQTATANWRGSHHDRAMEVADETNVLGDLDRKSVV